MDGLRPRQNGPAHKKARKPLEKSKKRLTYQNAVCYTFQAIVPKAAPRAHEPRWWPILKVVIGRMY